MGADPTISTAYDPSSAATIIAKADEKDTPASKTPPATQTRKPIGPGSCEGVWGEVKKTIYNDLKDSRKNERRLITNIDYALQNCAQIMGGSSHPAALITATKKLNELSHKDNVNNKVLYRLIIDQAKNSAKYSDKVTLGDKDFEDDPSSKGAAKSTANGGESKPVKAVPTKGPQGGAGSAIPTPQISAGRGATPTQRPETESPDAIYDRQIAESKRQQAEPEKQRAEAHRMRLKEYEEARKAEMAAEQEFNEAVDNFGQKFKDFKTAFGPANQETRIKLVSGVQDEVLHPSDRWKEAAKVAVDRALDVLKVAQRPSGTERSSKEADEDINRSNYAVVRAKYVEDVCDEKLTPLMNNVRNEQRKYEPKPEPRP